MPALEESTAIVEFWRSASPEKWHAIGHRTRTLTPVYERLLDCVVEVLHGPILDAIDWGVGGGVLAEILTPRGCKVYGADIVERTGAFSFVQIDIERPEDALADVPLVDLFACLTVIQHMPDRDYVKRILDLSATALVPGGVLLVQARSGKPTVGEYGDAWAARCVFAPEEFRALVSDAGYAIRHEEFGISTTSGYQYIVGQLL